MQARFNGAGLLYLLESNTIIRGRKILTFLRNIRIGLIVRNRFGQNVHGKFKTSFKASR